MPVQHGDDDVLRRMRRAVTARRMKEVVARFRDAIPGVTVRTTVLVGFPGETEVEFENLLAFIEDLAFDRLGVFTYSAEEGTVAATMAAPVPASVMAERAALVQETQDRLAWPRQQKLLGTRQTVLVDGPSVDYAFSFEGRLAGQAPEIDGVVLLRDRALERGRFADVTIVEVDGYELVGA
jgi:ribosomal protein S12 methylthiotransferase